MRMEKLENQFMIKLLDQAGKNLNDLYGRQNDFKNGKSINYCKINKIYFPKLKKTEEFKDAEKAFKLGFEFGVNVGIDTFAAILAQLGDPSPVKHKKLLSKTILQKLKSSKLRAPK